MRIAFVITRSDAVGGATVHVRDLASALLGMGHEPIVLLGGAGAVVREFEAVGVPVIPLRHLRRAIDPWHDFLAIREVERTIRRLNPDLVSAHTAKAGCIARLACARLNMPKLYTPHGWAIADRMSPRQGAIYRWIERAAAPLASTIVNVCEHELQLALQHRIGRPRQHAVVYNGMPDVARSLRADPSMTPPRIVMVARFEAPKDHLTLVDALAGLNHRDWYLDLVGDGPLENLVRQRVELRGIGGRVTFHGAVRNVAPVMAAAQIFTLSSRSEGFPRSILEAMRAGLPVVASDVGGVREAVAGNRTGYTVTPQSPEALRVALDRLIADPMLRARLGREGRKDYEQRFTFDRMLEQTVAIYGQLMGAGLLDRAARQLSLSRLEEM